MKPWPVLVFAMAAAGAASCGSGNSTGSRFVAGAPDADSVGGAFDASIGPLSGDSGTGPTSLYFQPAMATIVVDGSGPQTAKFTLFATDSSGNMTAVTPESVAFDRPDLGTVSAAQPVIATAPPASSTSFYAGTGTIRAIYRGREADATLTVQVHLTDYGPGLGPMSPAVVALNGTNFGSDPAPGITPILYPYDKTVWPLGLTSPLLMWNAPEVGDYYRLSYSEKNYAFDGYYELSSLPGQIRLDQTVWDRLTASNDSKNAPDPISFSLYRYDNTPGVAYLTDTETWTIAPESLQGAIYYWTASQDAAGVRNGHISRFTPGTGAAPVQLNNGTCMGCHAVNAQGTVLVADVDDQVNDGTAGAMHTVPSVAPYDNWSGTRAWASFDLTQPNQPLTYQSTKFGADVALTPDGAYVVFGGPTTSPGSKFISLGDPLTGNVIASSGLDQVTGFAPSETNLEMPAFSPDGKMLAVVESSNGGDRDNVIPGTPEVIAFLNFHESGPTFDPTLNTIVDGASQAFASTGSGLGYPSFTPDSSAIAFHAGTTSTGCSGACDDTVVDDGNLFICTIGTGTPIRLAAADDPPDPNDANASVEPTFNPVKRGGYSWAVFTSMRAWGNMPWPADVTSTAHVNGKRRLWVTAVDGSVGTTDPSHPAFYLEGQDNTPNMRGFWTLAACIPTPAAVAQDAGPDAGGACTNGFACCSGFCQNGVCVEIGKVACSGVGGGCTTTADCCNTSAGVSCQTSADGGSGTCGLNLQ
jgi:mono/diheme cytochrome c family protein